MKGSQQPTYGPEVFVKQYMHMKGYSKTTKGSNIHAPRHVGSQTVFMKLQIENKRSTLFHGHFSNA